jgi:hypothetical protein
MSALAVEMTGYHERIGYLILSFRALARNLDYCGVRFLLSTFVEMTRFTTFVEMTRFTTFVEMTRFTSFVEMTGYHERLGYFNYGINFYGALNKLCNVDAQK